jgi:hypothetical protein
MTDVQGPSRAAPACHLKGWRAHGLTEPICPQDSRDNLRNKTHCFYYFDEINFSLKAATYNVYGYN